MSQICKYFQYFDDAYNRCLHVTFGNFNLFTMIALPLIPLSVALTSSIGLGPVGFQIIVLMLIFQYGKKDSSSMNQAMSAGLYLSSSITNLRKKNENQERLANISLALVMIPSMLTGSTIGIHYKDYMPSLLAFIFTASQILLLIIVTNKKAKQLKSVQALQRTLPQDKIHEDYISVGDGIMLDFDSFFTQVLESPNRQSYIKLLPKDLLNLDLTIDEHKVRVKDYLNENTKVTKKMHSKLTKSKLPIPQMLFIGLIISVNMILLIRGSESIVNPCHAVYWSKLPVQFGLNLVLFVIAAIFTKTFDVVLLIKLWTISMVQGFLIGLIGNGASIFFLTVLQKVKGIGSNQAELSATLPIIMLATTSLNVAVLMATGMIYDQLGMVLILLLSFVGQYKLQPKVSRVIRPEKTIKIGQIFQYIVFGSFLVLQIPKILSSPIMSQLKPIKVCS